MTPVYFYTTNGEFGAFSNFSPHGFELDSEYWPTVEHYFQAQKFAGTRHCRDVRRAPTPKEAKAIGRDRNRPLRSDWEEVKDDVMYRAVRKKFETHDALRDLLLSTGSREIVEASPFDYYWGCGKDGSGKNRLGDLLMRVRDELR